MYAYRTQMDSIYFNGYGVKLKSSKDNPKVSYCNSVLQFLINIDRRLSHDLFAQIYDYGGDDMVLKELKTVFHHIADILEGNRERMDNLVESDIGMSKNPKKKTEILDTENPVDTPVGTHNLVKICQVEFKESLDLKNKANKQCFMEVLLFKFHQLFKKELECSFIQFSSDSTCSCPVHSMFGMRYIDVQASHDTMYALGNRFCIRMDIAPLLSKVKDKSLNKKDKLEEIEGKLFKFYQNYRMGKDIQKDQEDY
jgi:hypothetical protein